MAIAFDGTTRFTVNDHIISCPDGKNWIVSKMVERTSRETKEKYQDEEIIGYYGAPEHALLSIWRQCSVKSAATSLKAFCTDLAKMRTDILDAAKEFGWEAAGTKEKVA